MNPLIPLIIQGVIGAAQGDGGEAPQEPQALVAPGGPQRPIPGDARRGVMQPPGLSSVDIGGATLPLAAGLQIRDEFNRILVPSAVHQPALVRFTTDNGGAVHRVWILTAEEAARPERPVRDAYERQ
ncbi:MAG: hypothetical protein HY778_10380 [Betaproteobacteria bacterium]|nr:hypothetical protein [Betaproteobacteria bacterium]